jgi:hypothetical protein
VDGTGEDAKREFKITRWIYLIFLLRRFHMKKLTLLIFVVALAMLSTVAMANVTVTAATGGTGIPGTKAANGSSPAYTTIGNFGMTSGAQNDFPKNHTNATITFTAPSNWRFNPGVGSGSVSGTAITFVSISVTSSTITFTYTRANTNSSDAAITISGIQVQEIDGSTVSSGNIVVTAMSAAIAGVTLNSTNFGTLSGDGTLPVEMTSFAAMAVQHAAALSWSTATEVHNSGFAIERKQTSLANSAWKQIAFVAGAGMSNAPRDYSYVDAGLAPGSYAYRIKQINTDGSFEYHSAVEVMIGSVPMVLSLSPNYPNPFNPSTTIQFTVPENGQVTLKIYNVIGQEVATLYNGIAAAGQVQQVTFNASNLPSGLYISRLQYGNKSMMQKMMLEK